ncbi:hypothetical protein O6H91_04G056800 [Diphasiastrum complanatum]|uniref:Uncharacterized protein n=1 Tax=Diphasiastrum complanatum TaxID=34168 RepID=A0ACC2DX08_DIPCM|nr:hypothetical protein O6H91_04G056800 [Diphasiastrum complanatum]
MSSQKIVGDDLYSNMDFTVDLKKPLVFQVGYLGEAYDEWVHKPIVSKESPRFFANRYLESLTRTVWWVIPIVWLPVICYTQMLAVRRGLQWTAVAPTMLFGTFAWSFIEYSMHRFLFHVKTKRYWSNTAHYLLHGCHHKHPMDGYRLVFPPAATAGFCALFWPIVNLLFARNLAPSFFGGGLLGYVLYDLTHYFLHHGVPFNDASRKIKRYHLHHHFKVQTKGFGITSEFWDWVFGTLPPAIR